MERKSWLRKHREQVLRASLRSLANMHGENRGVLSRLETEESANVTRGTVDKVSRVYGLSRDEAWRMLTSPWGCTESVGGGQ